MSLQLAAERRAFASVTDSKKLAQTYVNSETLGAATGTKRPEKSIYDACMSGERPARVHIEGGPGSGKTSIILKVLGLLAGRKLSRPIQPLIVRTGASRDLLETQTRFLDFVIDLIATQEHKFASIDPDLLAEAAAEEITRTPTGVAHQVGLNAQVVSYQATITEAVTTLMSKRNAAGTQQAFETIIEAVAEGCRPLVVIDDTDHFAGSTDPSAIDEKALSDLYRNGVHTLAEFEALDLVVAIQPRFRDLPAVKEVEERFGFERVTVARLPSDSAELTLARVLARRLEVADISSAVEELIDDLALAALQSAYFTRGGDLRWVLDRAHQAAGAAVAAGESRIGLSHIQPLLATASLTQAT